VPLPDAELVGPFTALRRRWVIALVLTVLGAAGGIAAGAAMTPSYTAEARVAVGSRDLAAISIPGYALGSQQLASSIARYISQTGATAAVRAALGGGADTVSTLAASPIPESNIIRVEATAGDASTARAAADATAQYLVDQSSAVNGGDSTATLLATFTDLSSQVAAQAQARDLAQAALKALPSASAAIPAATDAYVAASAKYDSLVAQQTAAAATYQSAAADSAKAYKLVVVSPGADSYNTTISSVERYGLVGLAAGFLIALVLVTVLSRRKTNRRRVQRDRGRAVEDHPSDSTPLDRASSS
jgi:capsular polysaccharide biosynthesis protein